MSKQKRPLFTENYTFFFKDGYFVTFSLLKKEFLAVQAAISSGLGYVALDNNVIMLSDLRYVAKQTKKEEAPPSAIPEYMEQDVWEYLRGLERGKEETGY